MRSRGQTSRHARNSIGAALLGAAVACLLGCVDEEPGEGSESGAPPGPEPRAGFIASSRCASCHPAEYERWTGSHHDAAMQVASDETVLGDFDDARFAHFPVVTRFFRRDADFWVETEGADGETAEFPVRYTFGVEPLQQYLIELPGGRLQALSVAWDSGRGRWFDLYPDDRFEPGDPLHWTGRLQRWNTMCAECHSTDLRRGYDVENDVYRTTWAEIDVGCQACHGPAEAHVRWAEAYPGVAAAAPANTGLEVHFDAAEARREIEVCAPCHSRRHRIRDEERAGRPLLDSYVPATLREGLYHPDGQIDAEVYVYGSFVQSRMYQRGVRCSDCHDPHGLTLREEGNALCTGCHQTAPDPRFPTLTRKRYDAPAHHFHLEDSEGARCVACHMPARPSLHRAY